jgi:signal transduction histidine kinase
MDLNELINNIIRGIFILLGLITLGDYLRRRDQARMDIALMFGALAVTFGVILLIELTGERLEWLRPLSSIALISQPFLLVRLIAHFRPVPVWVLRATLAGFAGSVLLILIYRSPLPTWAALVAVAYFVAAETYAAVAFVRGARATSGVTRWRLLFAAGASLLLAVPILLAGLARLLPPEVIDLSLVTLILAAFSGVAYYFGFAPPRWLRRTWQLNELNRFLRALMGRPLLERAQYVLDFVVDASVRVVGGRAAVAALWDEADEVLRIRASNHPAVSDGVLVVNAGTIGRAWLEKRPAFARNPFDLSPQGKKLAQPLGAEALYAIPIVLDRVSWGILVVLLQRSPLFADDDIELLALFAEQTALALEQWRLLHEQTELVGRLREQTSRMEAANKELEAFSYSVSHDLRAPLRHIEGFTDLLLRQDTTTSQQRRHLERISEAAVRMGKLIDDLLSFSRMGRTELRWVSVRLDQVVAEAWREVQAEASGRNIIWRADRLPVVPGDPELLRLAFVNLLSNALKYTRDRDPAEIEVGSIAASADEVHVYVRDNGVGFDMQYADKLFGVFQRLHHSDEFEGVGIGLANVRRIVQRHGGRAWATSQLGRGATFFIALPARPPSGQLEELGGSSSAVPSVPVFRPPVSEPVEGE